MKKIFIYALSTALLTGCHTGNRSPQATPLLDLGQAVPLSAEVCWEYMATPFESLALDGEQLLAFQGHQASHHIIWLLDANNGDRIDAFLDSGHGPGEVSSDVKYWGLLPAKGELWFSTIFPPCVYRWKKTPVGRWEYAESHRMQYQRMTIFTVSGGTILENGCLVANNTVNYPGKQSPVMVIDTAWNILQRLPIFSGTEVESRVRVNGLRVSAGNTYQGVLASHGRHFAFGLEDAGYLAFYEMGRDGQASRLWEYFTAEPKYTNEGRFSFTTPGRFHDLKMTENFLFAAYLGEKTSETVDYSDLLVFNHKGRLLHRYRLDRQVRAIAVSPDGRKLYASVTNPETGIAVYQLPL